MHERASSLFRGGRPSVLSQGGRDGFFQRFKQLSKTVHVGKDLAINDARVRANLASWYVLEAGLKFMSYRALSAFSRELLLDRKHQLVSWSELHMARI